jgi:hypothetical protein
MADDAVSDLVGALEILQEISELQSIDLERSRKDAAEIGEMFQGAIRRRLEGDTAPAPFALDRLMGGMDRMAEQHARSVRRESALLDAFHALMRLHSVDGMRESAEHIFSLLRQIRMIDVGESPRMFTEGMPSFPNPSEFASGEDRKRDLLQSLAKHEESMHEHVAGHQQFWDSQIKRAEALLSEALAAARKLHSTDR